MSKKFFRASLYVLTILVLVLVQPLSVYADDSLSNSDAQSVYTDSVFYDPNSSDCSASSTAPANGTSLASGSNVYILGDSITNRSNDAYISAFKQRGITTSIDASDSRSLTKAGQSGNKLNGMQAIAADTTQIKGANAIVVALGTNGDNTPQSVDAAIDAIKQANSSAPIYWVDTIGVNGQYFTAAGNKAANDAIYSESLSKGYKVISWFKIVDASGNPQSPSTPEKDPNKYIDNSDGLGVHPTAAGQTALANLVAGTVGLGGDSTASGGCCSAGGTALTGGTNDQKVWNFFIGQGLTPVAAAGVMGNLNLESGGSNFDPAVKQGFTTNALPPSGDGATGYGIAQWTDRGRQAGLFKLIDAAKLSKYYGSGYGNPDTDKNIPVSDIDALLGIELNYAWSTDSTPISGLKDALNAGSDTTATTTFFQNTYERPASATASLGQRISYANSFLQQFGGGGGGGNGGSSGTSCGSSILGGVSSTKDGLAWAEKFVSDTSSKYSTDFSSLKNQLVPAGGLTTEVMYVAHHDHNAPTCWGAADCGQCTAVSGWFINNMTTAPGASSDSPTAWGNGIEVVNNLKAKGVKTGTEPQPFSIFSTNAYSSNYGHTGLVLGVLSDGSVITLENNMSDASGSGTGNLTIRKYGDIKKYFQSQGGSYLEFAYTASTMKNKPGGSQ